MIRINIPQPYSCKDCKLKYSVQGNTIVIGTNNYSSNMIAGYDYICCCTNQNITYNVYYSTFNERCPIENIQQNNGIVNTTNII